MKTKLVLAAFVVSAVAFAQKDEIKAAKKLISKADYNGAYEALAPAEGAIASADAKTQATYYTMLGDIYTAQAKASDAQLYYKAIEAYQKVGDGVAEKLEGIRIDLVNSAVADNNEQNYESAANKLYTSYSLNKKDTVYLYYAASSAVSGKDYETALSYYNMLRDLNYDGSEMQYTAINKDSGERVSMDKAQRDIMVKSGEYTDPQDKRTDSKRGEIVKNIALIYSTQGDDEKAMQAFVVAREENPEDVSLILNQANLYFKQGDKDKFKSLMNEAIQIDPQNADLHYNIGVISMEQNDFEGARASYKRATDIDSHYINAHLNYSTTFINEGNALVEQMNNIRGNSAKEIAKYDALKAQKDDLFKQAAAALEAAYVANPKNNEILEQLKNIYGALSDFANYKRVQALMEE